MQKLNRDMLSDMFQEGLLYGSFETRQRIEQTDRENDLVVRTHHYGIPQALHRIHTQQFSEISFFVRVLFFQ